MSVKMFVQESVIETVVNHQFEAAYVALDKCGSLEFSGFGRFYFNRKKALKKLEKMKSQMIEFNRILADESSTEMRKRNIALKLQTVVKNFEYLNAKLNGSV